MKLQGQKSLIFRSYKLKSVPPIKSVREHAESFQTFLACNCALKEHLPENWKKSSEKSGRKKKGGKKYLQPLLMTIRVICSLSLKKAIISTRLEKGTSWSGPLLWSWWCSLVSGYCYTKSGSKGPILCPRKDNENPTTIDETFNAFFLFPLVLRNVQHCKQKTFFKRV